MGTKIRNQIFIIDIEFRPAVFVGLLNRLCFLFLFNSIQYGFQALMTPQSFKIG